MENRKKDAVTESWLQKHQLLYGRAARHPFIGSIRDGTVDLSCFKTWLGQDYVFVRAFVPFLATVLVKASKQSDDKGNDEELILGGLVALSDEIDWFKKEASKWDVQLSDIIPQESNQDYCRFLESLAGPEVEYSTAITALWAIEAVYQDSFAQCLEDGNKTPPELLETCKRWGNESFAQYCRSLSKVADRCLLNASDEERAKAEEAFLRVLELEIEFWNMSRGSA